MRNLLLALLIPVLMGGCASTMSGLDGETKFACKAPEGVSCASLSGVYANAVANNLPALRKEGKGEARAAAPAKSGEIIGRAPSSGDPIRTQPKVLRIWIAPWEDSEGDLHDQSYIYVVADPGRWMIEHNQKRIVDRYRPTFIQAGTAGKTQGQTQPSQQSAGSGVVLPGAQGLAPALPAQPNAGGQE
ncbi:type IV conjugative transfer system lipoprotein TraV [Sulfuricystis multivorans]|uniref:type IV conjugative transfer system lipoprotein TraV n=1 Tax=Sulfuricystis multivorans TaxID=2211108 RepID=UPI000F82E1F5|nr:type IV conjugative transfer system lipoprotein TraV [Sulfuricystis multivorans]